MSVVSANTGNQTSINNITTQNTSDYKLSNSTDYKSKQYSNITSKSTDSIPNSYDSKAAAGEVTGTIRVTNDQVIIASKWVKNYIETNNKLPNTININGNQIGIYTFLYLLSTVVQNVYNKNTNSVAVKSYKGPEAQREDISQGYMSKAEYIHIADVVKVYMDKTSYVPGYATPTSLGTYFGWKSMIYMYSKVLNYYSIYKVLPNAIGVKPLNYPIATTKVTNTQVIYAAKWVKDYVYTNHQLPGSVVINGQSINMYTFLYLLSFVVQNVYNNNSNPVSLKTFNGPQIQKEEIHSGYMSVNEYIKIADSVKVYMDTAGIVPGYAYGTSLGSYFGWESMIYMYSKILTSYSSYKALSSVAVEPWYWFTNNQIVDAASSVKSYADANKKLPNYVTIAGIAVGMPSFLELLSTAVQNIYNKNTNSIYYNYIKSPTLIKEQIKAGNISIGEYISIADMVKVYSDKSWTAPGYTSSISLGTYFGYTNMIYTFSKILDYYNQYNNLPNYVGVKPWTYSVSSIPTDLLQYTKPTNNCQSDDPAIISLAKSLSSGTSSMKELATNIFNWVRDNIDYSFYYDTKCGAVGTLNAKTGNCVDTAHLLIALERAAGIPARYEHGYCQFSSGNWYGHVWAQVWVDGQWYRADASSSRNTFGVINNWNTNTATIYGIYTSLPF